MKNIKKKNALLAFDQLITSLTKLKTAWTPSERLCYKRVLQFLK